MILRVLLYGTLILMLALTGIAWWISSTDEGSRWVVDQVPAGSFELEGLSGNFNHGLTFQSLKISTESVDLRFQNGRVDINPFTLILMQVTFDKIRFAELVVVVKPPPIAAVEPDRFEGLPFRINVKELEITRLLVNASGSETELREILVNGYLKGNRLVVQNLGMDYENTRISSQIRLALESPFEFEGGYQSSVADRPMLGKAEGNFGNFSSSGTLGELRFDIAYNVHAASFPLKGRVTAEQFNLAEFVDQPLQTKSISVDFESDFETTLVNGKGKLLIPQLPVLTINYDLVVMADRVEIREFTARQEQAEFRLAGNYFLKEQSLALDLHGQDLPVALLQPWLPFTVEGTVSTKGTLAFGAGQTNLQVTDLSGLLNGYPLTASGSFLGSSADDAKVNVSLLVGNNRLKALMDRPADRVELSIDGKDLAALSPDLEGQLRFETKSSFSLDKLPESASLILKAFKYRTNSIESLSLRLQESRSVQSQLTVNLEGLNLRGQLIGDLKADLTGNLRDQSGEISWRNQFAEISTELRHKVTVMASGNPRLPEEGNIEFLRTKINAVDRSWSSEQLGFNYVNQQLQLQKPGCFRTGSSTELCLENLQFSDGKLMAGLDLKGWAINVANLPWAPDASLQGQLVAHLDLNGTSDEWSATYSMQLEDAELKLSKEAADTLAINIEATGTLDQYLARTQFQVNSGKQYGLALLLEIPDVKLPGDFSFEADVDVRELSVLTAVLPFVARGQGRTYGHVGYRQMGGQQTFSGQLVVGPDASLLVPALGLDIQGVAVTLNAKNETSVEFNAQGTSNNGKVEISGTAVDPLSTSRRLSSRIQGSEILAINRPEIRMATSPNLNLELVGNRLRVDGTIEITEAMVNEKVLRTQGRVRSTDVVVVDRPVDDTPGSVLELDLQVKVGEKVHINMYGLDADVTGALRLQQTEGRPRQAEGTLNISNGSFARYGVNFTLERGRLIYKGSLANPLVDVIARKEVESGGQKIVVKLVMSGAANDIQSKLVSTPTMSEADALSYLVLGRPLSTSSTQDGNALASAALSFGLKKAVPITAEIQDKLGLDQLTVVPSNVDTATVVAGKRISRKIYLEYNYGVFSRVGGLLLDYQLNERLSLRAQSGSEESIELIYKF